jgi:hypothetical protein
MTTTKETEYQKIQAKLTAILDSTCIYNQAEFKSLKETARRRFDDELSETLRDTEWWISTPYWHQLASCIKKVKSQDITEEKKESILKVLHKWEPIAQQLEAAVPLIVKGRKIGERKTPLRTLENTGTCPICGKNFKLDGGKIVSHGYVVQWHQHNGSCPGVGKTPWELSPQGAIDYLDKYCLPQKLHVEGLLQVLVWSPQTLAHFNSELRQTIRDVAYFENRIAKWEKKELPGGIILNTDPNPC